MPKLSETVLANLAADYAKHGDAILARVRQQNPTDYLRFVASCLPKDFLVKIDQQSAMCGLSHDQVDSLLALLRAVRARLPGANDATPEAVFAHMAAALDAYPEPLLIEAKQ